MIIRQGINSIMNYVQTRIPGERKKNSHRYEAKQNCISYLRNEFIKVNFSVEKINDQN